MDSLDLRYSATSIFDWNAGTSSLTRGSFVLLPNVNNGAIVRNTLLSLCSGPQLPRATEREKPNGERGDSLPRNVPLNARHNSRIDKWLMIDADRRQVNDGVLAFESRDELGGRVDVADGVDGDGGGKG